MPTFRPAFGCALALASALYACSADVGYGSAHTSAIALHSPPDAAAENAVFAGRDLVIFGQSAGEVTFWATAGTGYGTPERLFLQGLTLRRGGERDAPLQVCAERAELLMASQCLLLEGNVVGSAELTGATLMAPPAKQSHPPQAPVPAGLPTPPE